MAIRNTSDIIEKPKKIKIVMQRANQISELSIEDLNHTVILTDFNYTMCIPQYRGAQFGLRGDTKAYKKMLEFAKNAWGYYIVTSVDPGNDANNFFTFAKNRLKIMGLNDADSAPHVPQELKNTEVKNEFDPNKPRGLTQQQTENLQPAKQGQMVDLTKLFCPESMMNEAEQFAKIKPGKLRLLNSELGDVEEFDRGLVHEKIVMNHKSKAAGALIAIGQSQKKEKISNILLIDDSVNNIANFPRDIIKYLQDETLVDKLAENLTITAVWLDPTCEIEAGHCKRESISKDDDSFTPENRPFLQAFFPVKTVVARNFELMEYKKIIEAAYAESRKIVDDIFSKSQASKSKATVAGPLQFSKADQEILQLAKKYVQPSARTGADYQKFKEMLGISPDEEIVEINMIAKHVKIKKDQEVDVKKILELYQMASDKKKAHSAPGPKSPI